MWRNSLFKKKSSHNIQIDSLDGLRGVAIIFVFLSHTSNAGLHILPFLSFSGIGHYGVYLFFVLSSFLLTLPLLKETTDIYNGRLWLNYAVRRFFRIYPLFVLAVLIKLYLLSAHYDFEVPDSYLVKEFFLHLTLQKGRGVLWTIAVEFKFYFILPFIALLFVRVLRRSLLLSALAVGVIITVSMIIFPPDPQKSHTVELTRYIPVFLPGMLAALAYTKINRIVAGRNIRILLEVVALCAFIGVAVTLPSFLTLVTGRHYDPGFFHPKVLFYGALWSIFIVAYMNGYGVLNRLLSSKILRFLGMISFSAYLWHVNIINTVSGSIDAANSVKIPLIILITLGVSFLSYIIVERPSMRIRLKW
jgi:peptidoglycan/LPS O-acetylase OafA/YrhL